MVKSSYKGMFTTHQHPRKPTPKANAARNRARNAIQSASNYQLMNLARVAIANANLNARRAAAPTYNILGNRNQLLVRMPKKSRPTPKSMLSRILGSVKKRLISPFQSRMSPAREFQLLAQRRVSQGSSIRPTRRTARVKRTAAARRNNTMTNNQMAAQTLRSMGYKY